MSWPAAFSIYFCLFYYLHFLSFSGTIQTADPFKHHSSHFLHIISVILSKITKTHYVISAKSQTILKLALCQYNFISDLPAQIEEATPHWMVQKPQWIGLCMQYFLILGYRALNADINTMNVLFLSGQGPGSAPTAVIICFLCDVYLLG